MKNGMRSQQNTRICIKKRESQGKYEYRKKNVERQSIKAIYRRENKKDKWKTPSYIKI